MTRTARYANLFAVVAPFVAFLVACVLLWNRAVDVFDLALLAVMYVPTGLGITMGFHRLFTHRAFDTSRPMQYALGILGSMTLQGPLVHWVADHRKHHAHTDEEGDPHSPHVGHGSGLKGLVHAHVGWLLEGQGRASRRRYAKDLVEDPGLSRLSRLFLVWVAIGLLVPTVAGFVAHGGIEGAARGLLWGGAVRIFFMHHMTWSINSVCHFMGSRRFAVDDHSHNVFWLALPSLGESWHHNHHAFPRSAQHGLRWYELDVTAGGIRLLERLGLVWNVTRIAPERQEARLATRETVSV
ncbi:MAG: fatty acid desaturase [Solirubrobacterales bacterium]|nr:fatty acid desaturase [Solirubrobacterales bacterium]